MSVPVVTLTGGAVMGINPPPRTAPERRRLMGEVQSVRLGRLASPPRVTVPRLADYFRLRRGWRAPAAYDWGTKAAASIGRMFANDQYGDCVIADRAHSVGVWTAADSDSGGEVIATDREVIAEYHRICGPGDNGCVITHVLDDAIRTGILLGGRRHKIDGYVAVDPTNWEQVTAAQYLFGPLCCGVSFRQAWSSSAVWDVTSSAEIGGHDVGA